MIALFREYVIGDRFDITEAPAPTIFAPEVSLSPRTARSAKRDFMHVRRALLITEIDHQGMDEPIALAFVRSGAQVLFRTLPELAEID